MAYSTLVIINSLRLNIPVYGILDLGNAKLVKVEDNGVWYFRR